MEATLGFTVLAHHTVAGTEKVIATGEITRLVVDSAKFLSRL